MSIERETSPTSAPFQALPLVSKSPPTSRKENETNHLNESPALSQPAEFKEVSTCDENEWDPFGSATTNDDNQTFKAETKDAENENQTESSDWANFEPALSERNQNIKSSSDEDDDFADFVENQVTVSSCEMKNEPLPVAQPSQLNLNQTVSSVTDERINYEHVLDRIFVNTGPKFEFKTGDECLLDNILELIERNSTWTELKKFTSLNDASLSLKFKWYNSSLEDFYLNALNLERQAPTSKKKNVPNFVSNTILQPVKLSSNTNESSNTNNNANNNSVLNVPSLNSNSKLSKSSSDNSLANETNSTSKTEPQATLSNSNTYSNRTNTNNQNFDIDLSYFEKQQQQRQQQHEAKNAKPKTKAYLDDLLKEIYSPMQISDRKANEDQVSVDKKSFTSSSSSINELGIQLKPQNLEKDLNASLSDKEALEFAAKLPDLYYMKSKSIVLANLNQTNVSNHGDKA